MKTKKKEQKERLYSVRCSYTVDVVVSAASSDAARKVAEKHAAGSEYDADREQKSGKWVAETAVQIESLQELPASWYPEDQPYTKYGNPYDPEYPYSEPTIEEYLK